MDQVFWHEKFVISSVFIFVYKGKSNQNIALGADAKLGLVPI